MKKILVTGATGFKGSWLCSWLLKLGAKVYGTGFGQIQNKNLFYKLNLNNRINLKIFDVRDYVKLKNFIYSSKPSIIFHLAASSDITNVKEITMEANPGEAPIERLREYRKSGVNRISFGFQSLNDKLLRFLAKVGLLVLIIGRKACYP